MKAQAGPDKINIDIGASPERGGGGFCFLIFRFHFRARCCLNVFREWDHYPDVVNMVVG